MKYFKSFMKSREAGSVFFLIALILIVGIINPAFLEPSSLISCLNDSVVFTLLAVGIAFVLLTGEIDVSIGSILGLSAAVGATMLRDGSPTILAVIVALAIGALVGLVNGLGVAYMGIPSLIFTLGINGVVRGLIYVYTNGAWVENLPASYTLASNVKLVGDLTVFYAAVITAVLIFNWWTVKVRQGTYFKAVGDNIQGATLVGLPVKHTKVLAYILCGLFAATAGMVYASRIGFITPVAGSGYEMKAIAACVIGGIALTGGQGSLGGAAIGAIIMSSISRILVFMGFSSNYDNSITGVMLIVIVVVTTVSQNRALVKNRHEVLMARTQGTANGQTDADKGGRQK